MVYPSDFADEPIVNDTNIDQGILEEIFEIEQIARHQDILDQTADKANSQRVNETAFIEDFDEKGDPDAKVDDSQYAELPDLSEYENMIDWDDLSDEGDLAEHEKKLYNSFQGLNSNQA
jgi:hypothetical protein